MASARYTLNITPDAPEKPSGPMTPRQKWDNFWFYHKWHVVVGVVVALLVGLMIRDVVTNTEPDYTIGVLTSQSLPYDAELTLAEKLTPLCDDTATATALWRCRCWSTGSTTTRPTPTPRWP